MNRLVRRVFARKRFPRCTSPQNPKHSVENVASADTRSALAVFANTRFGDQTLDDTPLLVSELHVLFDHIHDRNAIDSDHVLRNRSKFADLERAFLRCALVIPEQRLLLGCRATAAHALSITDVLHDITDEAELAAERLA